MNISIVGSGLYSFTTASQFAAVGNQVYLFSNTKEIKNTSLDSDLLDALDKHPISNFQNEPGLISLFRKQVIQGRIKQELPPTNCKVDFVLLTDAEPSSTINEYYALFKKITDENSSFIIFSPSRIGETKAAQELIYEKNFNSKIVCVPLLIREGRALQDMSRPDNIIIGCDKHEILPRIKALFYPFNRVKNTIRVVASMEAEFASFAGNAMLATRLSFMNEMASLAEQIDVDVEVIRECIGSDPRIGRDYLYPGCGYGGDALEDNLSAVAKQLKTRSDDLGLLETVAKINERQKDLLFRKIWRFYKGELSGKSIAIWGASFKPGSGSLIGAPAISLIDSLIAHQVKVMVYDPMAKNALDEKYVDNEFVKIVEQRDEALANSDALAICTEWKEFWSPDFNLVKENLTDKSIFDGRNLYSVELVNSFGLKYFGIGRGEKL